MNVRVGCHSIGAKVETGSVADTVGLGSLLDEKWTRAMLVFQVLNRTNSSAKTSDSGEFLLDFKQPLLPLAVGKVGFGVGPGLTPIQVV